MADSPRRRYSRSPSPDRRPSRSRSMGRSRSRSLTPIPRSLSQSGSHGRNDAENPGNTLYITGLSSRVTERDLEYHFSKEGKVKGCFLLVEPRTRVSRGFAFVTMDTVEDADRCVQYLNQSVLEGRYITVEKSRRKRPRTPTPGNYLGVKSTRDTRVRPVGDRFDRDRYRRGYVHEDYGGGYHRSPRHSPYRGGVRGYSPHRWSPYGGGRSRRSIPYSPYISPGRRGNVYAR